MNLVGVSFAEKIRERTKQSRNRDSASDVRLGSPERILFSIADTHKSSKLTDPHAIRIQSPCRRQLLFKDPLRRVLFFGEPHRIRRPLHARVVVIISSHSLSVPRFQSQMEGSSRRQIWFRIRRHAFQTHSSHEYEKRRVTVSSATNSKTVSTRPPRGLSP